MQHPMVEDGITYWETQPASLDGVLGGFGSGVMTIIQIIRRKSHDIS